MSQMLHGHGFYLIFAEVTTSSTFRQHLYISKLFENIYSTVHNALSRNSIRIQLKESTQKQFPPCCGNYFRENLSWESEQTCSLNVWYVGLFTKCVA